VNVLAVGFPTPVSWVWDKATSMLGDAAGAAVGWSFEKVIGGLVAWVLDGVSWAVRAVFGFIDSSTSPNVAASWFVGSGDHAGPYRMMLTVAAGLLLLFVFAGIIQGVLAGDTGGMARRMLVDLPTAVAGMVSLVAVTQILVTLTDQLSAGILSSFGGEVRAFLDQVASVGSLTGGAATALVIFLLGLGTLLAALVIFVELVIRSALIYLVVGLCPLAFAALVWPATRGVLRRTLELLAALILSKLVVALALSIGAAALGGAMTSAPVAGGLSPPTAAVAAPSQSDAASVTSAAGVLLAGLATFAVACFSPFVVLRLFPLVETAVVAQGVRGAPMRTAQSAIGMKTQLDMARRYGGTGGGPDAASAGGASGPAAGSGAAAASAVVPVAAVAAAATASMAAARRAGESAASQASAATTAPTQPPPAPAAPEAPTR
jgi:hypothetical protein